MENIITKKPPSPTDYNKPKTIDPILTQNAVVSTIEGPTSVEVNDSAHQPTTEMSNVKASPKSGTDVISHKRKLSDGINY